MKVPNELLGDQGKFILLVQSKIPFDKIEKGIYFDSNEKNEVRLQK
ncbi:MAG: hypothetical protein PWP64_1353 [Candidatus Cloacimonadota bacterium]|nr:hypothetical protein [Candidatus Cloacimonadota bacterium]